jgi:hypothetical protein
MNCWFLSIIPKNCRNLTVKASSSVSKSPVLWIRIDFDRLDPVPDPGGQTRPTNNTKVKKFLVLSAVCSVVDHLDADPDSTYHPDADPDSDCYLMRIRMRIRILFDADPAPTFHPDKDPDPRFQIKAQTLEKVLR